MGGGSFAFGIYMCIGLYIYSYKLTVSNGGGGHLPLVSICAVVSIYIDLSLH